MIVVIEGSGRVGGNGGVLAQLISDTLPDVKRIRLHDLDFKDCNACGECRSKVSLCTLEDGLTEHYADILAADSLIFISPSYYGTPSGDMKKFIDRLYCMKLPKKHSRFKTGTRLLVFITQGSRRKLPSWLTLYWFRKIMGNHKCAVKGVILTDCSFDDHFGISGRKQDIIKHLEYLR